MKQSIYFFLLLTTLVVGEESFVIGGGAASKNAWPWQLALKKDGDHVCGATILSSRFAVTAATCVDDENATYSVVAGVISLKDKEAVERVVVNVTKHLLFVNSRLLGYPNDVAVISWEKDIEETEAIKFVKLDSVVSQTSEKCHITGWGKKNFVGGKKNKLQEAKVSLVPQETCRKALTPILPIHVCVEGVKDCESDDGGVAACKGDWGGPLVCQDKRNRWKLVGIASWGTPLCNTSVPTVFTRVSHFQKWISDRVYE